MEALAAACTLGLNPLMVKRIAGDKGAGVELHLKTLGDGFQNAGVAGVESEGAGVGAAAVGIRQGDAVAGADRAAVGDGEGVGIVAGAGVAAAAAVGSRRRSAAPIAAGDGRANVGAIQFRPHCAAAAGREIVRDGDGVGRAAVIGRQQQMITLRRAAVVDDRSGHAGIGVVDGVGQSLQRIVGAVNGDSVDGAGANLKLKGALRDGAVGRIETLGGDLLRCARPLTVKL